MMVSLAISNFAAVPEHVRSVEATLRILSVGGALAGDVPGTLSQAEPHSREGQQSTLQGAVWPECLDTVFNGLRKIFNTLC